jgi:cystathionine beta-lyase
MTPGYDFDTLPDRRGTASQKWDYVTYRADVIPMSVADAEFLAPTFIREAIAARAARSVFGYTFWPPTAVDATLSWLESRHAWAVPREQVQLCGGLLTGLVAALRSILTANDAVLINPPIYAPFAQLARSNGFQVVESPLKLCDERYTFDLVDMDRRLNDPGVKCLILCNPHNPVGRVYSAGELQDVLALCIRHKVTVISDEIHCDLTSAGVRHTPIARLGPDAARNTITLISPSKTFNIAGMPGAAIVCARLDWREDIRRNLQAIGTYLPSPFAVAAYEAAYRFGADYVDAQRAYIDANIDYACEFVARHCGPMSVVRPEGTYLLWVDCRALALSDEKLLSFFLDEAGLVVQAGGQFGQAGTGFIRMNVACPRHLLELALARLQSALARRNDLPVAS